MIVIFLGLLLIFCFWSFLPISLVKYSLDPPVVSELAVFIFALFLGSEKREN